MLIYKQQFRKDLAKLSFLLGVIDIFISCGQIKTFYHLLLATGSFSQDKPSCSEQITLTERGSQGPT